MRIIRRDVLDRLYPLPDGLNFTPVMSTRAIHEEIHWLEVSIPYQERVGRSKLSVVHDGLRFLYTIVWTALSYNPVRIFGGLGLILGAIAGIILAAIVGMRLAGIRELGPWGVVSLYVASLFAVGGVALFSLGTTFNYLVSLLHKRPIRQGLFGKPILPRPLEQEFGWLGLAAIVIGVVLGAVSLGLSLGGWEMERLWMYLLGSAMMILIGVQLVVFWIIIRVLDDLRQRELRTTRDMNGHGP
jgi:hypothetical protein